MDLSLERDSTALGSLFQQIIADMKNTSPLWEDFVAKASKLHACLRAAIQAIAAYLDAFQKIADAATNSRGASKEIGTALTRVCLRHKAVETRMKTFTSAIMDCLIIPLQEKLEDWKRQVATLDKEHAKEHKRCRTELKKRSSDTLRLQKKARKGQSDTIQSLVDSHMHDVTMRRAELEEVERKSLRAAMVEERMRYCSFVYMLQPVVKEECEVMSELGHLQEAMQSIAIVTKEPNVLPQSSEELILESKSTINLYPESPGGNSGSQGCSNSLGSRKSSVCSISSMNSSGSSGSPGHHHYQRSLSQLIPPAIRLKPGESSDSGFCSSPALTSQTSTSTSQSHAVSTWPPHSQDVVQATDRPHTISSAYEKGHQRPALTVYTFQNPETIMESQKSPATIVCRPPLPVRCSSLERPLSSTGIRNNNVNLIQRQCPSPIPAHITKELPQHQPTYVNMSELASMAAMKITNQQLQQQHQQIMQQQQQQQQQQQYQQSKPQQPLQSNSPNSNQSLSQAPSESPANLNSHQQQISSSDLLLSGNAVSNPSPMTAGTTPSSGDSPPSTSQNNSPQLTSSPQTPLTGSGCVIASNNYSTKDSVAVENELKITETDTSISNANNQTSTANNTPPNNQNSPAENDDIPRGSVLEKMSLFEKLEQQQLVNNNPPPLSSGRSSHSISSGDSIYGSRKEEIYKTSSGVNDKDPDQIYEDSIQELNNLIGELDSFQREHEMKEQENRLELQQGGFNKDPLNPQSISCVDTDSDKISIGSLNYSTQSTNASDVKFAYSDSEISRYVSESSSVGFENPTFAHFNNTDEVDNKSNDDDSGSGQITIYDHNFVIAPDIDYMRQNSEIVVLRCKDVTTTTSTATTDASDGNEPKQRLSSFRSDQLQQTLQRQQQQQQQQHQQQQQNSPQSEKRSSTTSLVSSDKGTASIDDYKLTKTNLKRVENYLVNDPSTNKTSMKEFKANLDERLRSKPIISPRPASLSGCVTRIARRSSVNTTKPPPPIRRSSSVTPSHNLTTPNSPNLIQQNLMNTSAESLPPPPAYLLDRTNNASPTINVAETVKALTVIRHTPASPSALRRAQNQQINQTPTIQTNKQHNNTTSLFSPTMNDGSIGSMYTPPSSNSNTTNTLNSDNHNSSFRTTNSNSPGIYAQPKQVTKMSSFRSPSPAAGPQKTSTSLIAQLNARLTPSKQSNQHTQQAPQHNDYTSYHHAYQDNRNQTQTAQSTHSSGQNSPHHQNYIQSEQIYSRAGERYYHGSQHQHQHQQSQHYDGKNNQIYTSSTQYQHHHYHIQNDSHHNQSQSGAITNSQAQYHHHNHHHQHHHPTHCHQPVEQQNQQPISHQHNQHHRSHVHAQHQLQQQQQHQSSRHNIHQKILVSTNPFITTTTVHYSSSSFGNSTPGQYAANTNYTPSNNEKSGSIRAKTKAEFLENLNAKLAKQGLSGRAFAVRNLINSKALHFENLSRLHRQEKAIKPDPRLCHESLMDQIKRGATLKRNRTINDRSAPKIH